MWNQKGKNNYMEIKVDLEKAYNCLCWDFILETLNLSGFSTLIIKLIISCISTTSMQVIWDGQASETFCLTKGIHQGDPLSPYLFVLCIDRLAHIIKD